MNDQEDGIELASVGHERVEGSVGFALTEAQRVVGTIGRGFGVGTAPSILPGGGDGNSQVFYAGTGLVVGRIVGAGWGNGAGWVEAVDPAPEAVFRIDFDRSGGRALVKPEAGLTVEVSCHQLEGVLAAELGMVAEKFADANPERTIRTIGILRSPEVKQHERLALVNDLTFGILLHERSEVFDLF